MLKQLQLFETPTFNKVLPFELLEPVPARDTKYLVCFSGGKDSIDMVLYLLELGVAKENIILHHHEVDGRGEPLFDWKVTTQYCRAFAQALGLTILFSYREGGIVREMFREKEGLQDVLYQREMDGPFYRLKSKKGNSSRLKFPAVQADLRTRWCSVVAKIDVLSRVITNHPDYQRGKFVICTGERAQESTKRASYKYWQAHTTNTKKGRNCIQWRPILDRKENQVWERMKRHRIQPHPCYELGWSRCSCQTCIFGSANVWASIQAISPEKIDRIEQLEQQLGHTLYHGMPIRVKASLGTSFVNASTELINQATQNFTLPIILPQGKEWQLPKGAFGGERAGAA